MRQECYAEFMRLLLQKDREPIYQKLAEVKENVILDAIAIADSGHAAVTAVGVEDPSVPGSSRN